MMNFKIFALAIIGITFLFQTYVEWLQIKSAEREIPENVRDVYDKDAYQKWLCYYKEKTRLSLFRHIVFYVITFVIVGFDVYAGIVDGLSLKGDYAAALGVLVAHMLVSLVYDIPFSYVNFMKVEQKYGFNRMTKKTFIVDQIKQAVIGLVLTGGICALFILVHKALGNWLLPVFTGIMLVFLLVMAMLTPVIGKIYNKFQPLPEGGLKDRLTKLLEDNGCTVKAIRVMDGSRRSTKANAFFAGMGRTKTIVLYDTLLEQMTEDEIMAVFAHEMGHNKHRDILKNYAMNIFHIALAVLLAWGLVSKPEIYGDFGFQGLNYGFGFYLLSGVCLSFLSPFLGLFTNLFFRQFEYAADRFAAENGYGEALVSALKVLARNSFYCLSPHPVLETLTSSHPTISQRVAEIENLTVGSHGKET
ncbi:M48 family metallopeptidase [uncultured Acetatifactor sp.]|uniref:M48 family metallopeptidase n=1 Tax=uncultured Acetatifactor sp. TaxID=1671927 RepID=UPI002621DB38|nr:M48 family metallopeptidase [uncultured Acetatifactor sp.]